MILHPEFVYLHLPKCAGSKVHSLFIRYFSDIPFLVVDTATDLGPYWHDSLIQRGERDPTFALHGRTVISGFRRLPVWLRSRFSYERERSPHLLHPLELLHTAQFREADGSVGHADLYARHWLPPELLDTSPVEFLRVEAFPEDFCRIFGQWLPVERIPDAELRIRENTSAEAFDIGEEIARHWQGIYDQCPHWSRLEAMAFQVVPR